MRVLTLALVVAGLTSLAGAQDFVRGRVLVKFYGDATAVQKGQALRAVNARASRPIGSGIDMVELPSISSEQSVVAALSRNPKVQFAELDAKFASESEPNDPLYSREWYLPKISAPGAWMYSTGSATVTIAVLDTGVDLGHPDLASKLVPGWNAFNGNSDANDVTGHGTRVAGVACSVSNNGIGVASLTWSSKLMPVRVTGLDGYATSSAIVSGLNWAAEHGARVANVSFGITDNSAVRTAAQNFNSRGGVVVAAAGNSSTTWTTPDNPYIVTVSATDTTDSIYSWSDRGSNVDVAAPGFVFTTVKGGTYSSGAGTSFASPIVASLAALILSVDPTLSANQVMSVIESTCDDLGTPGWDNTYANGRINAKRAIEAVIGGGGADSEAPTVSVNAPAEGATVAGIVTLSANATDNVGVASVTFWVDGVQVGSDSAAPYTYAWNSASVANGPHTIVAKAVDAAGNLGTGTISVTVSNGSGDNLPPVVQITAPTSGSVVTTNQNIYAQASDNVTVSKVELYIDGKLTATSTSAPFTTKWNTRKAARGTHVLKLRALDPSGNASWSDPVDVVK